jgi:orotate phosphoribosyltransferase
MTEKRVLRILQGCGAVHLNSHFCLTPKEIPPGSGIKRHYHSDTFVAKDRVFENALELYRLAGEIANRHLDRTQGLPCQFVLGLEKGAIALANYVCFHLQLAGQNHVRAGYAEAKAGGGFTIGRGFARNYKGTEVLIVEDIVVSGTSVRGAVDAVRENGGIPTDIWAICLRGDADTGGVPLNYLYKLDGAQMWLEDECPLCADPNWGQISVRTDVNKHGPEFFQRIGMPIPDNRPEC